MARRLLTLLLIMCASLVSPALSADEQGDRPAEESKEERARQLFTEGREAMSREDYETACAKFEKSLQLFRRASMLLNLGACQDKRGKLGTALGYWREGLSAMQIDDPRIATAKEAVQSLEQRAPRLLVVLDENVPDEALVSLDGRAVPREQLDKPLYLDPGTHELTLDAPGHEQHKTSATAYVGKKTRVTLVLGAEVAPDVVTVTEANTEQAVIGWALGGVGVGGLVVGAVTGALVLDAASTVEDNCEDDICRNQAGVDAAEEGRTFALLSTVGFVAGAALVGVGVVLIVTANTETREQVSMHVGMDGISLRGSF